MQHKIRISVCMATYNGGLYVAEQLNSVLSQISLDDEIIIVDDNSSDDTVNIIKSFSDDRIRLYINEQNLGVNSSFEKAIGLAQGNFIFMSDQDDIWTPERLSVMLEAFKNSNKMLVSGNTEAIDSEGQAIDYDLGKLLEKESDCRRKNILRIFIGKAYYYGCAMAFLSELKDIILPFPAYLESHDLWIAMAANMLKSNFHTESVVLKRRIHGSNASIVKRGITKKIKSRWLFLKSFFALKKRIKKQKRKKNSQRG